MYQRCQPFFGNPLRLLRVHVRTCNQPSATTYVSINRWGSINSTKLNLAACWVIIRLGHPNKAQSAYMYICGILLLALGLARELIPSRVTLGASLVLFYTRLTAAFTNLKKNWESYFILWWSHTSKEKQLVQNPCTPEISYTLGCMKM